MTLLPCNPGRDNQKWCKLSSLAISQGLAPDMFDFACHFSPSISLIYWSTTFECHCLNRSALKTSKSSVYRIKQILNLIQISQLNLILHFQNHIFP